MKMRKTALTVLTVAFAVFSGYAENPGAAKPFPGPFDAEAMVYYIVHEGGDLKINVGFERRRFEPAGQAVTLPQAMTFQLYDAEERPVKTEFHRFPDDGKTRRLDFSYEFKSAPAGIYQVRTAVTANSRICGSLSTEPAAPFGVMPSRCMMAVKSGQSACVYVPPKADTLKIYNRGAETTVCGPDGKTLATVESNQRGTVTVTPENIYKLTFSKSGIVGFDGFPVILCPDPETAKKIRAGVVFASDGTMFFHQFQVRMWEWMKQLNPAQLEVKAVPLESLKEKFMAVPASAALIGPDGAFNHAAWLFENQNLDPKSPDYGDSRNFGYLALFYALNAEFNPYRGNPAILNRLLLNQYRRLLKLDANGTFHSGWSDYSGGDALSTLAPYLSFMLCGKEMPQEEKELWETGIGFEINRFCLSRVSCENQSSHWLVDAYCMYLGGAGEVYKDIAAFVAVADADPELNRFIKTGYMQEQYGPDSTYQGLCACNLAFYYAMSHDKNIEDVLSKIYSLFNHTVAPEPDGTRYGASNFCHRTKGSWVHRQWNGGTNLMSGWNEDAACWHDSDGDSAKTRFAKYLGWHGNRNWYENNERWTVGYAMSPWLPMWSSYFYPATPVNDAKLPVLRSERFFRDFNGEFYCDREPDSYTVVYAGKTSYDWRKNAYSQVPFGKDWKKDGDTYTPVSAAEKKAGWCPTQGIALFWTPGYGNCIIGKNWNVYTGQFVRADLPGGKVSWPDYWTAACSYDKAKKALSISNRMWNLPMASERKIGFLDNGISVTVKLTREKPAEILKTVEQIPYLKKADANVEFFRSGKWSAEPGADTGKIRFVNSAGKGVLVTLAEPTVSSFGPSTAHFEHTMGLIELGIRDSLSYRIAAIR